MSEDIKPCPFCGEAKLEKWKPKIYMNQETNKYYIQCGYCDLRMPITCLTKKGAIEWWNTRPKE